MTRRADRPTLAVYTLPDAPMSPIPPAKRLAFSLVLAAVAALPVSAQTGTAAARVATLLGPASGPAGAREIAIDLSRLDAAARAGEAVALDLPGRTVVSRPERVERRGDGRWTWFGDADGGGRATITVENGRVAARIQTPRGITVVEPRRGGHVAFTPAEDPDDVDDALLPPPGTPRTEAGSPGFGGVADPLFPDEFHMALFYTGAVADSLGDGVGAFLQGTVDVLTDVLANSNVPARARLVASAQVDYVEPGGQMADDLYAFQDPFDGQMDEVHGVRDAASADFAALLTETGGNAATGCGIAFLMSPLDVFFADAAFSVTKRSCQFGLVFSHEIGHNLGLHHDRYVTQGSGAFEFSHGFTNIDSLDAGAGRPGFRTVLAYNNRCQDAGGTCDRIPYYSNPELLWNGQPMGAEGTEDNARSTREAVPFASAFRRLALTYTDVGTTVGSATWLRPVCPDGPAAPCSVADAPTTYRTAPVQVGRTGRFYVRTEAAFDGVVLVYTDPFDPTRPTENLVGYAEPDPDAPPARRLMATVDLVPGVAYTVVTTGRAAGEAGAFTGMLFGPPDSGITAAQALPSAADALSVVADGPNPARGSAAVSVRVASALAVEVAVFDVLGRRVATLHDGALAAGAHPFAVPALPAGVYVVRARTAAATATLRVTRL